METGAVAAATVVLQVATVTGSYCRAVGLVSFSLDIISSSVEEQRAALDFSLPASYFESLVERTRLKK